MKALFLPALTASSLLLIAGCSENPGQKTVGQPDGVKTEPPAPPTVESNVPDMLPPPPSPPPRGLVSRNGLFYKDSGKKPFSGKYEETHEDGSPHMEIHLANGQKHGVEKSWSEDGTLLVEANFSEGKRHGTTKSWYENGQLLSESGYLNGLLHGSSTIWHPNGKKDTEAVYKFGKIEGKMISWHVSGDKATETDYKNNQKQGMDTRWDAEGKIFSQARFNNGVLVEILVEPKIPLNYTESENPESEDPVLKPPVPQEIRFLAIDAVQVVVRDLASEKVLLSKSFQKDETVVLPLTGDFKILASKGENLVLSKDGADTQLDGGGILNRVVMLKEDGSFEIRAGN